MTALCGEAMTLLEILVRFLSILAQESKVLQLCHAIKQEKMSWSLNRDRSQGSIMNVDKEHFCYIQEILCEQKLQ